MTPGPPSGGPPRPQRPGGSGGPTGDDRAVSDLVGFILVFSLVVSVVAIISIAGLDTLQSARDAEQTNNAERAFEVLSDNVDDVIERGAPSRATEISLNDNAVALGEETTIEIRDPDEGSGDPSFLINRTFKVRPVIYDAGDTELVYVMGAVFRDEREGGTILDSWSPVLEPGRTHIPVVNTKSTTGGTQSVQSSTVLVRTVSNQRVLEVANESASFDDVWINVTSPRQDLWFRMLDEESALDCSTVGTQTVECQLTYVPERIYVVDHRLAVSLDI